MNKDDKNHIFEAEILNDSEEYLFSQCKKKKIAGIMCMFLGTIGIDKFIMGCKKSGWKTVLTTVWMIVIALLTVIFCVIPVLGWIVGGIILFCIAAFAIVRYIYYFILGIKILKMDPKEVALRYEIYKQKESSK